MDDWLPNSVPPALPRIEDATKLCGFDMPSERQTGALLRTLVSSKPGGHFLELGTGTGLSAAWLLDGMDETSCLTSIDSNLDVSSIARTHLGDDSRFSLIVGNANDWLRQTNEGPYDLIFADAMPGKYEYFDEAWSLLRNGGIYVIDDMLPQSNWPDGHGENVERLLVELDSRMDCHLVRLMWGTGIVIATRTSV